MPHDHHDHDDYHHEGMSSSGHPYRADNDGPLTYWQRMEIAVRELLVEKSHLTCSDSHSDRGHGRPQPRKWCGGRGAGMD